MDATQREDAELERLIDALRRQHGYDFSEYAQASFRRRVQSLVAHLRLDGIAQLTERVLEAPELLPEVIARLAVPTSEMFRDPEVFARLREDVLPRLASYPRINVWQAGCARGEETYSLAILLEEAELYERTQIYATDISGMALEQARDGIFPARELQTWAANYLRAGGRHTLSDYFHARYGHIKFDDSLRRNVVFAPHNLVADAVFCEAQLVLCRNVLIYFRPPLQRRALALFRDSLVRGGYLCLGAKESLGLGGDADAFAVVDAKAALYRRIGDLRAAG